MYERKIKYSTKPLHIGGIQPGYLRKSNIICENIRIIFKQN